MSNKPWHKRYHSDALAGFMALNLEERGAYQTILDMIYDRGGPIIDNERLLAGYMQVSVRKWRSLREILIEKGKVSITPDGLITNVRAEKELENTLKTSRKHAENGLEGARKKHENAKKLNENNENNLAKLEQNSSLTRAYQRPEAREVTPQEAIASFGVDDSAREKPVKASSQGTRLPEDWMPDPLPEKVQSLVEEWPDGACPALLDEFRDYWTALPGAKARKLDWNKTWHNRIRDRHDTITKGKRNGRSQNTPRKLDYRDALAFGDGPDIPPADLGGDQGQYTLLRLGGPAG